MRNTTRARLRALRDRWPDGVWNIGQLDPFDRYALSAAVRGGLARRERVLWPWVHVGTVYKTRYVWIDAGTSVER
jgi:hypothetical protein